MLARKSERMLLKSFLAIKFPYRFWLTKLHYPMAEKSRLFDILQLRNGIYNLIEYVTGIKHTIRVLLCFSLVLIYFVLRFLPTSHYSDVIMSAMASQMTGVTIVYSIVCSGADRRKHQSYASLAFVRGINRSEKLLFCHRWISINSTSSTPGYPQHTFQVEKYWYQWIKARRV